MNVLLVGSGAREHALAWCLKQSPHLKELWVAKGNAGTASIARNIDVDPEDVDTVAQTAKSLGADLVIVGPDMPLAKGLVDRLHEEGVRAFGPTQAAARIESSKVFALDLMDQISLPHPASWVFFEKQKALDFLEKHPGRIVVKADGLAYGKGAWPCQTAEEAAKAVQTCMADRPGEPVILQEFLYGREVSVFAFSDGKHISSIIGACDYKRVNDGDLGPNTGGMGSFAWPDFWTEELASSISRTIMQPVVERMAWHKIPFQGMLYGGLMIDEEGPKVLEFNARFGDPEAQVILPLLATDLLEVLAACAEGRLDRTRVDWKTDEACVGVVMASGGYPGEYKSGFEISGLGADEKHSIVFHAGTKHEADGKIVTSGGRVLTVVGKGPSLEKARERAYARLRTVHFADAHHREDIAQV